LSFLTIEVCLYIQYYLLCYQLYICNKWTCKPMQ